MLNPLPLRKAQYAGHLVTHQAECDVELGLSHEDQIHNRCEYAHSASDRRFASHSARTELDGNRESHRSRAKRTFEGIGAAGIVADTEICSGSDAPFFVVLFSGTA